MGIDVSLRSPEVSKKRRLGGMSDSFSNLIEKRARARARRRKCE
jgi:hypothetical protein